MSSSKSVKKVQKKVTKKATPLSKDKSPVGSKIGKAAVGALDVRNKAMVHMKVEKICKHQITPERVMYRLAGTTTSKNHHKLSKIVSKDDAMLAKKELGVKVVECKTTKVKKVKKDKKVKKAKKTKTEKK